MKLRGVSVPVQTRIVDKVLPISFNPVKRHINPINICLWI